MYACMYLSIIHCGFIRNSYFRSNEIPAGRIVATLLFVWNFPENENTKSCVEVSEISGGDNSSLA